MDRTIKILLALGIVMLMATCFMLWRYARANPLCAEAKRLRDTETTYYRWEIWYPTAGEDLKKECRL